MIPGPRFLELTLPPPWHATQVVVRAVPPAVLDRVRVDLEVLIGRRADGVVAPAGPDGPLLSGVVTLASLRAAVATVMDSVERWTVTAGPVTVETVTVLDAELVRALLDAWLTAQAAAVSSRQASAVRPVGGERP